MWRIPPYHKGAENLKIVCQVFLIVYQDFKLNDVFQPKLLSGTNVTTVNKMLIITNIAMRKLEKYHMLINWETPVQDGKPP